MIHAIVHFSNDTIEHSMGIGDHIHGAVLASQTLRCYLGLFFFLKEPEMIASEKGKGKQSKDPITWEYIARRG